MDEPLCPLCDEPIVAPQEWCWARIGRADGPRMRVHRLCPGEEVAFECELAARNEVTP